MRSNISCPLLVVVGALSAFLLVSSSAHAQNLIVNGGFESGATGWTVAGNVNPASTYAAYAPFGLTGNTAPYGASLAAFNGGDAIPNGTLSQVITTIPGSDYTVSYVYGDFNTSGGVNTQAIRVTATDVALTSLLNAQTITTTAGANQIDVSIIYNTIHSFSFTAIGTSTQILFADQTASQTNSADGMLDNVSVTRVVSTAAPEPSSLALLAAPVGLLFSMARRKARRR